MSPSTRTEQYIIFKGPRDSSILVLSSPSLTNQFTTTLRPNRLDKTRPTPALLTKNMSSTNTPTENTTAKEGPPQILYEGKCAVCSISYKYYQKADGPTKTGRFGFENFTKSLPCGHISTCQDKQCLVAYYRSSSEEKLIPFPLSLRPRYCKMYDSEKGAPCGQMIKNWTRISTWEVKLRLEGW